MSIRNALPASVVAILLCTTALAQQPDTTAQCGFSRIDFANLYKWFSPASARTTRVATMRAAPSAGGKVLKTMAADSRLYVVSDSPRTLWYQVIDPATGKLGWMHGDALEVDEGGVSIDSTTTAPEYTGPLRNLGNFSPTDADSNKARLRIVNHYPTPLTLLLAGKMYTVPATPIGKTRSLILTVNSGQQGYIIIVHDPEVVDVFFGFADLAAKGLYEYEVDIQSIE